MARVRVCLLISSLAICSRALVWDAIASSHVEPANITVCIPAIPENVFNGDLPRLFRSIAKQTVPPRELVVALSNASDSSCETLEAQVSDLVKGHMSRFGQLRHRVLCRGELLNPARSRNAAAREATSAFVGFFDADDEMHPQRLEVIQALAKRTRARAMAHFFTADPKWLLVDMMAALPFTEQVDGARMFKLAGERPVTVAHAEVFPGMQHSHITVARDVLQDVQFRAVEDEYYMYYRQEDSYFVRDILTRYGEHPDTFVLLKLPLSFYTPGPRSDPH